VAATLAICVAIVAGSCGGESERRENRDPGGGGASGATGGTPLTGGALAIAGTTGAMGGSVATGGSLATAGTTGAMGGSVATGGSSVTGGTGADSGGGADGGTTSDGGAGAGDPSTEGCRDPREPGCATCCAQGTINCVQRNASSGSDWYNEASSFEGPCPESCPRCAACSLEDENDLITLGCRADCDCENTDIEIDPCFSPQGCACYCFRTASLRSSCPHVVYCE
jgi:hypothetical protein